MARRGTLVALLLSATALLLAGCTAPGAGPQEESYSPPTSKGDAALVATSALADLEGQMDTLDDTGADDTPLFSEPPIEDMRLFGGIVTLPEEGEDDMMGLGGSQMELAWEWGQDDVSVFRFSMASGAFTIAAKAYCSPAGAVLVVGTEAYESRPTADASCDGAFGDMLGASAAEDEEEDDAFDQMLEEGPTDVTLHADGSITAVFVDDDGNRTTIEIDDQGRPTRLLMDSDDGSQIDFHMDYGPRKTIRMPTPDGRMPAEIDYEETLTDAGEPADWKGDTYTWTVTNTSQHLPLSDFEAHVKNDDANETILVRFAFDAEGPVETAGHTFAYDDADGDGLVSAGDSFTVTFPDPVSVWSPPVAVHDLWAGADLDEEVFTPGPGMIPLLGTLGAAVLLARRGKA